MNAIGFSFTGRVTRKKAEVLLEYLKRSPCRPETEVTITSKGGLSQPAIDFFTSVQKDGLRFKTVGIHEVSSSAIPLFLAGNERVVARGTKMSFHSLEADITTGRYQNVTLQRMVRILGEIENEYAEIVAGASQGKLTKEAVISFMSTGKTLSDKEIVLTGLTMSIIDL